MTIICITNCYYNNQYKINTNTNTNTNTNNNNNNNILYNSNKIEYNDYVNELREGRITRIASRVQYDGTDFKGWQEQEKNIRTIQGTLSTILSKRFNVNNYNSRIIVIGASRTDYGVHSKGQAIHFDLNDNMMKTINIDNNNNNNNNNMKDNLKHLEYTLNRMLPDDLKLYNMSIAPLYGTNNQISLNELWHARKSAIGKLYTYRFCHNTFIDPTKRRYVAPCRKMNMKLFNECLQLYTGLHDFKAFADRVEHTTKEYANEGKLFNTTRFIHSIKLLPENDDNNSDSNSNNDSGYYKIDIHIESAMYKMIRNMVGTAMYVANGGMDRDQLLKLLDNNDDNNINLTRNDNKAKSAPPEGLCLQHVYYDFY